MGLLGLLSGGATMALRCGAQDVALGHAQVVGERLEGEVDAAAGEVRLRFRGKPLATYAFADSQFKPYLRSLHTLRGENVLRDAPPDHLHHHGLMYAIRVNGVNFWEERPPAGRQVSVGTPVLELAAGWDGLPQAVLRQDVDWRAPGEGGEDFGTVVLRERRRLVFRVNPALEEVAVEWSARMTAPAGGEGMVLHGADYNGLGMRLPEAFDHVATFLNPTGLPYSEAQTWDVRPVGWTAAAGRVQGQEVTVVLAADRANPGPSAFFTMRNAFAYLAATQDLGRRPLDFGPGAACELRYLVLVYPAHQNLEFLGQRLVPWLAGP